jgi:hypothetical protein
MSENIYDILAKFPKDVQTSPKEVEPLYESVDPQFELVESVNRLEELYNKFNPHDEDEAKYLNPQAKRFVQLAKAKFPETSSDLEAVVAAIGDKTQELDERDRETSKWLNKARATISQQQREIEQTEQAINDANDRYDAQEKRFQDFNRQVAAAELDVKQQAQAALDYAKQPQAQPQAIINKVQAQQPNAKPSVTTEPTAKIDKPTVKSEPVQQAPAQAPVETPPPADDKIIDFDAEKKKRETDKTGRITGNLAKKLADIAAKQTDSPEINWDEKKSKQKKFAESQQNAASNVNTARQNWEILSNARLNPQPVTELIFGDKSLHLKPLDVQSIYNYLILKSTRNIGKKDQQLDTEFLKNLIKSNLNSYITVIYLLKTNEVNKIRTTLKGMETKLHKAKQTPIDYTATAKKSPQQQQQTQQPGLANTNFGKYIQQKATEPPQQGDLFGNPTMSENINKLAKSLLERFAKFNEDAKPDFLDLDKDGDTDEPMKQAAKDAKKHEPADVDKDAVAKRKRLQALKDKQEDERAEKDDDYKSASRFVKGRAYGGSAQKDDEDKDEVDEGNLADKVTGDLTKIADKKGYKSKKDFTSADWDEVAKPHGFTGKEVAAIRGHKLAESRNTESSEYTYETIGRVLCDEQPGLNTNSEAFVNAVYDELIEMKLTPKAARWLVHYDQDFLSDCATSYGHFCRSKEKEMAECSAPMNSLVSEEPVDAVQELDEIARLAGLAPKMESKCPSCGCADCKCNENLDAMAPSDSASPLTHTCEQCGMMEDKCSCTHESMMDESQITEAATRKDFRAVAELLKNIEDVAKRTELAIHHADIFKEQNPRFKREMFLAAAGVDTTPIEKDEVVVDEAEMGEGNEFSGALAAAKASGAKEFEVDGKKYTVKEDINVNVSANGEEDVVNLIRKLSGMPVVAIQAQPAEEACDACGSSPCGCEALEEDGPKERDVEYTNTPREEVAGTDAAIPSGTDLNRAKKSYKKEYPGDNPMAVKEAIQNMLWNDYQSMINDVKA